MSGQTFLKIRGAVRGSPVVAADLNLTVGDGSLSGKTIRRQFELAADDGRKYRVETTDSKLLGPKVRLKGKFSELAGHPLLEPFDVKAGPHVEISLDGAAVQNGEQAVIYGRTGAPPNGFTGEGNVSPEETIYIKASIMASGPEAEKLVAKEVGKQAKGREDKSRDSRRLGIIRRNLWALYLLPALALMAVHIGSFDGLRKLAIALLLTEAVFAARRRAVPVFHALMHQDKATETIDGTAEHWPTWDFMLGCYMFIGFIGLVWGMVEAAAKLKAQFSPFLALVPAATVLLYLRARQGPNIRRLKALLKAQALPDQTPGGTYDSAEGKLTCAAPTGGPGPVSCIWCEFRTWDIDTGRAGGSIAQLSRAGPGLALETARGTIEFEHGPGVLWASASKTERRTGGWKQLGYQSFGGAKIDTEDYIPEGSRILAAGRILEKGDRTVFSAEGTEAVLLFASGKRNPKAAIRLAIAAYVLSGWLLILAAAAPGALGLACKAKPKTPEKILETTEAEQAKPFIFTRKILDDFKLKCIPAGAAERIVKETGK